MRTLASIEDLSKEAHALAQTLSPREEGATLITLSGELGAGKTTFVQALARALGVTEHITSPTFVLAKTYALTNQAFKELVHIDAYRLQGAHELKGIGFDELCARPEVLLVLEWPECVEGGLPVADVALTLSVQEDQTRILSYD